MNFKFAFTLKENEDYEVKWVEKKVFFNPYEPVHVKEKTIKLANGKELESVQSPKVNDVVLIEREKRLIPVVIMDGTYLSNGRVSNFWTWREINDDLSLSDEKSGYGDFYEQTLNLITSVSIDFKE